MTQGTLTLARCRCDQCNPPCQGPVLPMLAAALVSGLVIVAPLPGHRRGHAGPEFCAELGVARSLLFTVW